MLRELKDLLLQSVIDDEYGDIRSILDEQLSHPTWSEQVEMVRYLGVMVDGALFSFDRDGWGYAEEWE